MYLKQQKLVTRAARPSLSVTLVRNWQKGNLRRLYLIISGTHVMLNTLLVNGAATEASASDNEMPTSAALRAPQSFAPSPQKPQQ